MSKRQGHLTRLFTLHDEAVEQLSQKKGGPTDIEELKNTFKKFLTIAVASFFEKEVGRIGGGAKLAQGGTERLIAFILFFEMDEEKDNPELADAVWAYFELRDARNEFAHAEPGAGSKKFDNWTVEDVRSKYERALIFLPEFEKWARKFAAKQRGRK